MENITTNRGWGTDGNTTGTNLIQRDKGEAKAHWTRTIKMKHLKLHIYNRIYYFILYTRHMHAVIVIQYMMSFLWCTGSGSSNGLVEITQ